MSKGENPHSVASASAKASPMRRRAKNQFTLVHAKWAAVESHDRLAMLAPNSWAHQAEATMKPRRQGGGCHQLGRCSGKSDTMSSAFQLRNSSGKMATPCCCTLLMKCR